MPGPGSQIAEAPIDLNAILNAPDVLAVKPNKSQKKAEVVQEKKAPPPGTSFDRSKFVVSETTGIDNREHHKKIHKVEKNIVEFSPEMKAQFDRFLTTHVENLLRITNPQVLDNPTHLHEKMLLEALTTGNQLDKSAVANFLKTEEGWSITEKLIEHQTALKLTAIGLEAAIDPQGKRVTRIDDHTVSLHMDQGALNHLLVEKLGHWLNEKALNVAGRPHGDWRDKVTKGGFTAATAGLTGVVSGLGVAIAGSPAGALFGLGVPTAEGVAYIFRKGVQIDINQSIEALKVIKNIPGEAEYMRAVLDVDIDALKLNIVPGVGGAPATTSIIETPNHTFIGRSMDDLKNEIYQGLFVRQEFYQSLGIPPAAIDALPEQFLFQANPKSAEQTGTRLDKRIQEKMDFNNPRVKALSESGRLKRFFQMREEAMIEQLDAYGIKVMENTASTNAVTRIDEKIARKRTGGAEIKERTDKITKRKEELEKEKTKLTDPEKAAKDYKQAQEDLTAAQESFKKDFPVEAAAGQSVDDVIATLNKSLTDKTDPTSITSRRQTSHIAQLAALQAQLAAALGALPPRSDAVAINAITTGVRDSINDAYKGDFADLDKEEAGISAKIVNLEKIKTQLEKAQKDLPEKSQALLGYSARVDLPTVNNHYSIVGVSGLPNSTGINDAQLGILSVDEIMVEINRVHAGAPARGWAEVGNNDPANRQMVIDAIAEAKARFKEAIDPDKAARDVDFTQITGWAISDIQLRSLSRGQLLNMVHLAHGANPANGWAAGPADAARGVELDRAMEEARNRMILRYGGIVEEQTIDLQTRIDAAQEEITSINFENDTDILTTIGDVMDRQGKVFEVAYQMTSGREKYVDTGLIDATDATYSQNEKDAGFPKGYWEMMDGIFGYKEKPDRGSYVLKIAKTLPPDALARQINDALKKAGLRNIPVAGMANYSNLNLALNALDGGLQRRSVNGFETRRLFADIINNLRAQANAL